MIINVFTLPFIDKEYSKADRPAHVQFTSDLIS